MCYGVGLGILLLASLVGGTHPTPAPGSLAQISTLLDARIALAVRQLRQAPPDRLIFERVRSTAAEGERSLSIRIAEGWLGPLRQGAFVVVNRLQLTLKRVELTLKHSTGQNGSSATSPLVALHTALRSTVKGLVPELQPREYTLQNVGEAFATRTLGRVVIEPLDGRLLRGDRSVELRVASVRWSADVPDLHIVGLALKTAAGQRLEASEARLTPSGDLVILGSYHFSTGSKLRSGHAAVLAFTPDGTRLVHRKPLPLDAFRSATPMDISDDPTWTAALTPLLQRLFRRTLSVPISAGPAPLAADPPRRALEPTRIRLD